MTGGWRLLHAGLATAAGLGLLGLAALVARRRDRAPAPPPVTPAPPSPLSATAEGAALQGEVPNGTAAPEGDGDWPSADDRPSSSDHQPHGGGPAVAILLPVRDEADDVLPCVRWLLDQRLPGQPSSPSRPTPWHHAPGLRVVVIDDGSTDGTRELVTEMAAAEPRLEVVDAGPLPAGWGGKMNALESGRRHLAATDGPPVDWVLTTDADTRHHPLLLAHALEAARLHRLDLVSLSGHQAASGLAENLLTPPVFALLDFLLGDWRRAARGDGPPVANGQYMLFRADWLERIGGFAAAEGAAIDDLALARAVVAAGGRCGFLRAPALLQVRMYRGASDAFRGWRRNLGGLFGGRPDHLAATLAVLTLPVALAATAALDRRRPRWLRLLPWASGAFASAWLRGSSGHRPGWGLLYPADALTLAATLALGAQDWRRGQLVAWKGRRVEAR